MCAGASTLRFSARMSEIGPHSATPITASSTRHLRLLRKGPIDRSPPAERILSEAQRSRRMFDGRRRKYCIACVPCGFQQWEIEKVLFTPETRALDAGPLRDHSMAARWGAITSRQGMCIRC